MKWLSDNEILTLMRLNSGQDQFTVPDQTRNNVAFKFQPQVLKKKKLFASNSGSLALRSDVNRHMNGFCRIRGKRQYK